MSHDPTVQTPPRLQERLPPGGATIFTVMSALAQEHGAINLGQGFPDFDCVPALRQAVRQAMDEGHNQYAPMPGWPALLDVVADNLEARHGWRPAPATQITITAGATQALHTALLAAIGPGDEVIVLEPAYDSYLPCIAMAGGVAVTVPMTADFRIPWEQVQAVVGPRTRAIVINSPHNPSGSILAQADIDALAQLVEAHDLLIVSDEVYEHMVHDGAAHLSMLSDPRLAARSFVVSSFGKTLHVTGWKVGYCVAPPALSAAFRRLHQFIVFSVNTAAQVGIARFLQQHPQAWQEVGPLYERKRERFRAGLLRTRLRPLPCAGTYFQVVDYSAVSDLPDVEFARWLTLKRGVASIPMSAFHRQPEGPSRQKRVRLCFAKKDQTLDAALQRLDGL